jgi:hypothetical protein
VDKNMKIEQLVKERQSRADDYLETKRTLWREVENIFFGRLGDRISSTTQSRVFDHKISTMILESEARVMAQMGTGKVKAISKNDQGAAALMNLMLDKYVIPNANAQFPLLLKHRIMHRKSKIYGNSFGLVDWDVKRNGYEGPDLWLLSIWDVFPQVGALSIDDSDYIIIRTWRPLSYFENLKKKDGFKNIDEIITQLKEKSGDKGNKDYNNQSTRESKEYPDLESTKGSGYYEVFSMFERDRWVDYLPGLSKDADGTVFRDRDNPNKDGELPVVNKYGIPLDDDIMGLGDAERGKTMQYAINSSWNLALDSAKMSIFPPVVFNKDAIIKSSIKRQAGANWLARGNVDNVARAIQLSPQGMQTHQALYNLANAALLNMFGTTDTSVSTQTDSSFGKTPEALKQQAARENARDSWDKFYVDLYLTQVNKKFVNMLSKRQSGNVEIRMFEDEIEKLASQYPDIREMYDEQSGKLKIKKGKTGSILYDYEIVSGSSFAVDQRTQQENLLAFFELLMKYGQQLMPLLQQEGTVINLTKLLTGIVSKNIENWDEILITRDTNSPGAKMDEEAMMQHEQELMNTVQQMVGGDVSQIPPQLGQPELPVQPQMNEGQISTEA